MAALPAPHGTRGGHVIDGRLAAWEEVAQAARWSTLLAGNGLGINVWSHFAYTSLHERAPLSDEDTRLFTASDTTNFERALADVAAAMRVGRAYGADVEALAARYRAIQSALGAAVRAAHVPHAHVPPRTLAAIRATMLDYDRVFTTSYDLIAYWAMGHGNRFDGFCDFFWSGRRGEFDVRNTRLWSTATPVLFLHGALHLIVEGSGRTRKLKRRNEVLLDQFGQPIPGDPDATPLLVTEGSARDKLSAIGANDYLTFALETLQADAAPLVVFGHSLSTQDRHLIDAINLHRHRPVAVSVLPDDAHRVRARQGEIRATLDADDLYFFDATTHPLGRRELRVPA